MMIKATSFSLSPIAAQQVSRVELGNIGTIIFGLGTLALEAGARTISFTIVRDESGRPHDLYCSHDGAFPEEETLRSLLGAEGGGSPSLHLLPAVTAANRVELTDRSQDQGLQIRWEAQRSHVNVDPVEVESDLPTGEGVTLAARGLRPDLQDVQIVGALQRLPIGSDLAVYLDDGDGRTPVSARSYGGSLLAEGELPFMWKEAGEEHHGSAPYRLNLLDSVPKGRVRAAAPGVDLIQNNTVPYRGTFGLPIRTTNLGRLTGWFETGDWLSCQPGSMRLTARGPTRAFLKAARQLILNTLAGVEIDGRRDPHWLARLSSDLTQRLSKAVRERPELAPIVDIEDKTGEHWEVLDIPYRMRRDGQLRLRRPAIRVDFTLADSPDDPPGRWDRREMAVLINARHRSAPTTAKLFQAWSLQMASITLASLRPGGHRIREAVADGTALAGQAASASATPASTRSQRELRKRKVAEARLVQEITRG